MNPANVVSRALVCLGSVAMLAGALDFMEGSLLILPGSGLVALGTYAGHREHRWIIYRTWVFILIAIGVGAMWAMSVLGDAGRSAWWDLLLVPYLLGWSMGIWGPGSPRWLLALGIVVASFHLWLVTIILNGRNKFQFVAIALGLLGIMTIAGCIIRWMRIVSAKTANTTPA